MSQRGFDMRQSLMQDAHSARKAGFAQNKQQADARELSVIRGLQSISDDMVQHYPRINESLFKRRYLDSFAGYGESLEENYAIYLEWIQDVAKQYNIPVHVCDDNDDRNILFTVPSVTNVQTVNPMLARNEEVQYAISRATQARHMQPYKWESMLSENLMEVYRKVYDKNNIVTSQNSEWAAIFERYADHFKGRERLVKLDPTLLAPGQNENNPTNNTTSAQTDYDEVEEEL